MVCKHRPILPMTEGDQIKLPPWRNETSVGLGLILPPQAKTATTQPKNCYVKKSR